MPKLTNISCLFLFFVYTGGGGTFGIVTHINYRVHPHTEIVQFNFNIFGRSNLKGKEDAKNFGIAIQQWLEFFFNVLPTLDENWCGGHFGHNYAHMVYCGSIKGAKKTFLSEFVTWEQNDLVKTGMRQGVWGSLYSTTLYNSWYEYTEG